MHLPDNLINNEVIFGVSFPEAVWDVTVCVWTSAGERVHTIKTDCSGTCTSLHKLICLSILTVAARFVCNADFPQIGPVHPFSRTWSQEPKSTKGTMDWKVPEWDFDYCCPAVCLRSEALRTMPRKWPQQTMSFLGHRGSDNNIAVTPQNLGGNHPALMGVSFSKFCRLHPTQGGISVVEVKCAESGGWVMEPQLKSPWLHKLSGASINTLLDFQ